MLIMSMLTDRIGRHKVLLLILKITISEKRRKAKLWKKGKICIKRLIKEAYFFNVALN